MYVFCTAIFVTLYWLLIVVWMLPKCLLIEGLPLAECKLIFPSLLQPNMPPKYPRWGAPGAARGWNWTSAVRGEIRRNCPSGSGSDWQDPVIWQGSQATVLQLEVQLPCVHTFPAIAWISASNFKN